jgi:hypothetical protein
MFAEELGGNTNRRRQEEARARRRKLKQQQDQQKKAQEQKASTSATTTANDPTTETKASVPTTTTTSTAIEIPLAAEASKPAAVANALQQRQQRQAAQHQQKAALRIQSFYRAHRSNINLLSQKSTHLSQRLQDISTLRDLLQQANTDYVPPPATSTALCQQLLFLTKSLPYKRRREEETRVVKLRDKVRDSKKVQQMLELVLLPGIDSPDENVHPFVVWLQSRQGQLRLEALLRLCLVTATMSNVDDQVLQTCRKFLDAVTVPKDEDPKVLPSSLQACRPLLFSKLPPVRVGPDPTAKTIRSQPQPHARMGSSLDMIAMLRHHLLYCTGGPEPIPQAADRVRESCISAKDRAQADALFQIVLKAIQETRDPSERQHFLLRFVSEILTVPLLTWKTSDHSTSQLLAKDSRNGNNKIFLIALIENFTEHYGTILTAGDIHLRLRNDKSLTTCPATPTQCLLANLIQIGRSCIQLNGSHVSKLDYQAATTFFRFIATLVDAVPLATFTSRESVVEWISDGKGHHSPVVLSPVVMEQCKCLLVDSFVRKLFRCAIDETSLKTDEILKSKTEKDLKHEKDLQNAGANAASLAAKEARIDRSKSFWNSSAWARKLTKGVSKMLAGDAKNSSDSADFNNSRGGKLIDASSVSRKLAMGGSNKSSSSSKRMLSTSESSLNEEGPRISYTPDLLITLCQVYGIVLARWGGGGGEDIVKRVQSSGPLIKKDGKGVKQGIATSTADISTQTLLNVLCFSTSVLRVSWGLIQSDSEVVTNIYSLIDPSKGKTPVRCNSIRPSYGEDKENNSGAALLLVFVCALSHILIITDDTEIHDMERPLPLHQLRRCIQTLKQLLYRACCIDDVSSSESSYKPTQESNYFGNALIYASSRTMRDLYDRSSRRPFSAPRLWLIDDLMEKEIRRCSTEEEYVALLSTPVLRVCPFLVSFKRRLKLFERIVCTCMVYDYLVSNENSCSSPCRASLFYHRLPSIVLPFKVKIVRTPSI